MNMSVAMAGEKEKGPLYQMEDDHKINFNWNWNATLHMNRLRIIQCSVFIDSGRWEQKYCEKINK